jgi:hypothetical protein
MNREDLIELALSYQGFLREDLRRKDMGFIQPRRQYMVGVSKARPRMYTAYYDGVMVRVKARSKEEAESKARMEFKAMRVGSVEARFMINEGNV